eukprot:scaffold4927_cov105-Cylindrotheca_fusiformis.AAC.3
MRGRPTTYPAGHQLNKSSLASAFPLPPTDLITSDTSDQLSKSTGRLLPFGIDLETTLIPPSSVICSKQQSQLKSTIKENDYHSRAHMILTVVRARRTQLFVLSLIYKLAWVGVANDRKRYAIIADFPEGGLESHCDMTGKEISDAMTTYAKRTDGSFPIILTRHYKKRLWPWVLWKKDRRQTSQVIEFPDGKIEDDFKTEIKLLENSKEESRRVLP